MSVNVPPESTPTRQRSIETILRPPGPWPRRHSVTRCAIEHADMRTGPRQNSYSNRQENFIRRVTRSSAHRRPTDPAPRSEEHTSDLQSIMRISYAVLCLKKKQLV